MLAGGFDSARCRSTNIVRAQLCIANTRCFYSRYLSATPKPQPTTHGRAPSTQSSSSRERSRAIRHGALPSTVAYLSSTSAFARVKGRDFSKPRVKPKFRVRTEEEHQEFIRVLEETKEQYEAALARTREEEDTQPLRVNDGHAPKNETRPGVKRSFTRYPTFPKKRTQFSREDATTTELENELYFLSHNDPRPTAIYRILKILVHDRKIKPKAQYYEAQILTNVWPEWGSIASVQMIMTEMEVEGIEISANIVAAVLKVLAVRPSPELSRTLLDMAERQWIQLPSQTSHHLILAMIRTGQTELAAWTLDVLRTGSKSLKSRDREIVPDYLVVLLITELVSMKDWEGVLRYFYKLRNRRAADREIPVQFWAWLLARASTAAREVTEAASQYTQSSSQPHNSTPERAPHDIDNQNSNIPLDLQTQLDLSNPAYHLTQILWTFYAANMSARPSWSTCLNILHCAANTGTPRLADSVLATMTYLNGINNHGQPNNTMPPDIQALATQARLKAQDLESAKLAAETDEQCAARLTAENTAVENKRKDMELEEWYADLFKQLAAEKEGTLQPDPEIKDIRPTPPSTSPDKSDTSATAKGLFEPFDPTTVPPGNLWPLFPEFAGTGSAHIDPWDALGPRSSSRRKWTEAQEHYKRVARAMKKKF